MSGTAMEVSVTAFDCHAMCTEFCFVYFYKLF